MEIVSEDAEGRSAEKSSFWKVVGSGGSKGGGNEMWVRKESLSRRVLMVG